MLGLQHFENLEHEPSGNLVGDRAPKLLFESINEPATILPAVEQADHQINLQIRNNKDFVPNIWTLSPVPHLGT
ncbi:unnamed protein product [Gordionus sp. m RMFG-2023]